MGNVTYLLGAGASINELPDVKGMVSAIKEILESFRAGVLRGVGLQNNFQEDTSIPGNGSIINGQKEIIKDFERLLEGCEYHLSIDTFAKMLFLTSNPWYNRFKATVALFFELYQFLNKKNKERIEKRYDAFLASILQNRYDDFPKHVKVLSWNYDNLFEKAYSKYLAHADQLALTPSELLRVYNKNIDYDEYGTNRFCIFKINGSANFIKNNCLYNLINAYPDRGKESIFAGYYEAMASNYESAISFNWDESKNTPKMDGAISDAISEADILVVIGYSFPFFNRDTDKKIFSMMPKLKKVYLQDPNARQIRERILAIRENIDIKLIDNDTEQFYLPHEL